MPCERRRERARLTLIGARGRTGGNSALAAIGDAHRHQGYRVVGLGANTAAAHAMADEGFGAPQTVHSALTAVNNRRDAWDPWTLLIVDGAARLEAPVLGTLLERARETGAKLVLLGDGGPAGDAGGGMLAELARRHGSIRIDGIDGQADAPMSAGAMREPRRSRGRRRRNGSDRRPLRAAPRGRPRRPPPRIRRG